jgi:uncharacterized RDD family membrane protein YckC
MAITVFHRYSEKSLLIRPATFKERVIAQLIDGIILGFISGFWLAVYSRGDVYSAWVSPMIPVYLLQVSPDFIARASDWWWGGLYVTSSLPFIADLNIAYPSPVLWLLYGSYYTLLTAVYGNTPGKMMKGLVVLRENGEKLSGPDSLLRWFFYIPSILLLGAGIWMMLKGEKSLTLHDLLIRTKVSRFSNSP